MGKGRCGDFQADGHTRTRANLNVMQSFNVPDLKIFLGGKRIQNILKNFSMSFNVSYEAKL